MNENKIKQLEEEIERLKNEQFDAENQTLRDYCVKNGYSTSGDYVYEKELQPGLTLVIHLKTHSETNIFEESTYWLVIKEQPQYHIVEKQFDTPQELIEYIPTIPKFQKYVSTLEVALTAEGFSEETSKDRIRWALKTRAFDIKTKEVIE